MSKSCLPPTFGVLFAGGAIAPCLGGIIAAGILAELGDIRRFNRLDDLAAIVGLVPGIYESNDHKICLGLSKRSNRYMRSLLVEATWVAVRTDYSIANLLQEALSPKSLIKP